VSKPEQLQLFEAVLKDSIVALEWEKPMCVREMEVVSAGGKFPANKVKKGKVVLVLN
jgi:hypothetical protein